jgi:acetyl esterase/lipase
MQVFESDPADNTKPVLLYLHGGGYCHNFAKQHWKALAEWADVAGCGIVAPNYPLLPLHTASEAHPPVLALYRELLQRYPADHIVIAGDSAGGGFTLALAQEIRDASIDLPGRLILIAPWVDILGGDASLQKHDNWLMVDALSLFGRDWAGDIDPHDPMVSPLYGDMNELPPTDIYAGTWDVLYTDVIKAYDKMKAAGVDVRLHVGEKMDHVYPILPTPEGKAARKEIAEILSVW